jgi:hypothetical protein
MSPVRVSVDLIESRRHKPRWRFLGDGTVSLLARALRAEYSREEGLLQKTEKKFDWQVGYDQILNERVAIEAGRQWRFLGTVGKRVVVAVPKSKWLSQANPADVLEIGFHLPRQEVEVFRSELSEHISDFRANAANQAAAERKILEQCKLVGKLTLEEGISLFHQCMGGHWFSHPEEGKPNYVLGRADDAVAASIVETTIKDAILDDRLHGFYDPRRKLYQSSGFPGKTVTQVTVDYPALKSLLSDKGLIVQVVRCPSCSGQLPLPEKGSYVKCAFCDSTVYATDVFDRLRAVLDL